MATAGVIIIGTRRRRAGWERYPNEALIQRASQ